MALAHALENFVAGAQLSFLGSWPGGENSLTSEVSLEILHAEMPVAVRAFDIDAIFGVDRRHHGVTHVAPGSFVGEQRKDLSVNWNTAMLHQRQYCDRL